MKLAVFLSIEYLIFKENVVMVLGGFRFRLLNHFASLQNANYEFSALCCTSLSTHHILILLIRFANQRMFAKDLIS